MRIVIADDEKKVCQLIYHLIDWQGHQFVGFANDGNQAFQLLIQQDVDVLITDIRMPGLNGLNLIKKIRENNQELAIIIISGYDDFDYAQTACRYGVSDYILKPIKRERLTEALESIRERLIESNRQLAESFSQSRQSRMYQLLADDFGPDSVHQMTGLFQQAWPNYQLAIIEGQLVKEKEKRTTYQLLFEYLQQQPIGDFEIVEYRNQLFLLLGHCQMTAMVMSYLQAMIDYFQTQHVDDWQTISIGLSKAYPTMEKLTLDGAKRGLAEKFKLALNQVYLDPEVMEEQPSKAIQLDITVDYALLLDKKTRQFALRQIIDRLAQELKATCRVDWHGYQLLAAISRLNRQIILELMKRDYLQYDVKQMVDFDQKLLRAASLEVALDCLRENIGQVLDRTSQVLIAKEGTPIRRAKEYIERHYMEDLSLISVSSQVGLNPSYFSSLFKKECGTNFASYVSEVRLEKAKKLIRTTNHKVSEITQLVGYYDISSFNKKFKKYTGLSPGEYKKMKS